MSFSLSKWYLDVVGAGGEVCLAYAAELTAGPLRQRYASVLLAAPDSPPRSHTVLRDARVPVQHGAVVEWAVAPLKVAGCWRAGAPAIATRELLDEPGALTWHCLQPRADAEVVCSGRELSGTGYVEHLELTVPPWQLPIEELRWGRAHVGEHTLVWIDWRGPRMQRHVFLDGVRVDGEVTDTSVRVSKLTVTLTPAITLRDGDVARTALARAPALRSLLARHKLTLDEHKWLSTASVGRQTGWAIHEVVRWR